jgi:hypothetical protein
MTTKLNISPVSHLSHGNTGHMPSNGGGMARNAKRGKAVYPIYVHGGMTSTDPKTGKIHYSPKTHTELRVFDADPGLYSDAGPPSKKLTAPQINPGTPRSRTDPEFDNDKMSKMSVHLFANATMDGQDRFALGGHLLPLKPDEQ